MSTFDDQIAENKRKIEEIIANKANKPTQTSTQKPTIRQQATKIGTRVKIIKLEKRVMELDIEVQKLRDIVNHICHDKSHDD